MRPRPLLFGKEGERDQTVPERLCFGWLSLPFGEKGVELLLRFLLFLFAFLLHL